MPAVDAPLDEALLRRQVENVELVDPGRHDDQRPLEDRLRGRLVLQNLAEIVAGDDLAGCERDIEAERKLGGIRLAKSQLAAAGHDVLGQHFHAGDEIGAMRGDRRAIDFGIGDREICRRKRSGHLLHVECRLVPRMLVQPLRLGNQSLGPGGGNREDLPHERKERVLHPVLVGESLVSRRRRWLALLRRASELRERSRPDPHIA